MERRLADVVVIGDVDVAVAVAAADCGTSVFVSVSNVNVTCAGVMTGVDVTAECMNIACISCCFAVGTVSVLDVDLTRISVISTCFVSSPLHDISEGDVMSSDVMTCADMSTCACGCGVDTSLGAVLLCAAAAAAAAMACRSAASDARRVGDTGGVDVPLEGPIVTVIISSDACNTASAASRERDSR